MSDLKITVVTPSFNQGAYIEKTLVSVLTQAHEKIEYFVVDGGSTDGTKDIIERYATDIDWWVSEPDAGQSDAINKGFQRATGDIVCWLNSDDMFLPGTLEFVANYFSAHPHCQAIVGDVEMIYEDGRKPIYHRSHFHSYLRLLKYWRPYRMHQAAIFWRRELLEEIGLLDVNAHLCMDYDYWLRIARKYRFKNTNRLLSRVLYHSASKTGADNYRDYHQAVRKRALEEIKQLGGWLLLRWRVSNFLWDLKRRQRR